MNLSDFIQPGMNLELTFHVEEAHTAAHIGSGSLRVLATPTMITFMEKTSHQLVAQYLPAGYSSVGSVVNVRHLAPTPEGDMVRVRSEVLAVEGARVNFRVEAWDSMEKIGEGDHQRVAIDEARFFKRVSSKRQTLAG